MVLNEQIWPYQMINKLGIHNHVNLLGFKQHTADYLPANGLLVPVKDVQALVAAMNHFITYPIDINRFGLNGRQYSKEKFDVNLVNYQMLNILQD